MTTPNIIMTRVDERLIHGQGQLWVKYLGCNTVIVANDEVSTDKIQQTLMKTVVPDSIAMRCKKLLILFTKQILLKRYLLF